MRKLNPEEVALVRHLVIGGEPPRAGASIDWESLAKSAGYHRLIPLVYEGLKRSPIDAPEPIRVRMEKAVHIELARTVVQLGHVDVLKSAARPARPTRPRPGNGNGPSRTRRNSSTS